MACGLPVAAYPVTGPRDVIGDSKAGVLHEDLRTACLEALKLDRADALARARLFTWRAATEQFFGHLHPRKRVGERSRVRLIPRQTISCAPCTELCRRYPESASRSRDRFTCGPSRPRPILGPGSDPPRSIQKAEQTTGELRMNEQSSSGGVSYKQVGADYFAKRGLKRYAKVWSLWALGVGAVISGHYSGWNFGLANGFGSMLVALFIIAAMYWGLIFSLAEMSPALPHTGAAYSFARSAMGPWGGMFTGSRREHRVHPDARGHRVLHRLVPGRDIRDTGPNAQPVWWAGSYVVFLLLNLLGVELSFRVSVLVTVGGAR